MEIKYDRAFLDWEECINNESRSKVSRTWLQDDTLDRWRHHRMLSNIDPLITPDSSWLTIGDGRYGTDAHYLITRGSNFVTASDMYPQLLEKGLELGFITDFSQQNAELLSYEDNSFDYIVIKEALHHCPRPWIALYEAFRVAKKGVFLIEPNQSNIVDFRKTCLLLKNLIRLRFDRVMNILDDYWFESDGNFGFTISRKEVEKFLLAMHFRNYSYKYLNDRYIGGGEFIKLPPTNIKDFVVFAKLKLSIYLANFLAKIGLESYSTICCLLHKNIDKSDSFKLSRNGWISKTLPLNPFL